MPYKDESAYRMAARERMRKYRARKKQASAPDVVEHVNATIDDLAEWAASKLIIPFGHPLAGNPLILPDYGVDFLRDSMTVQESLLSVARKNAKSAVLGVYELSRLVGPLQYKGYRGSVTSVTREKAAELAMQMEAIAEASSLIGVNGLKFMKSPRCIVSLTGRVDILSADGNAGHASGFDDAIVDEIGLLKERDRELINGLRTSVSARNGRFIGLSIQGNAPFTQELLDRREHPGVIVHHYAAGDDCDLDDEEQWHRANPGLRTGIKSLEYMRARVAAVKAVPADQASFRAYDLNQPQDPAATMLIEAEDWKACEVDELPGMDGPMILGVDLSSGFAMSAAAAYWPETGRLQFICAFPDIPDLKTRGENDGVGDLYIQMFQRHELIISPNSRTVDVDMLLKWALDEFGIPNVVVCDLYRFNELVEVLEYLGIEPEAVVGRGMGWRDGSEDVRAFQRAVKERRVKALVSLTARSAFSGAVTLMDSTGNLKLAKATQGGRRHRHKDDLAAAAMLAVSVGIRQWRADEESGGGGEDDETEIFMA